MIVSQAQLDLVLNRAMRSRVIHLPVRYGRFGERKRCPAKAGGVYRLRASLPELYARHKHEANAQPTRARAVLSLFDLCHQPVPSVQITVSDVALNGDTWVVQFARGEHREEPLFLAANPDSLEQAYTSHPGLSARGTGQEVPARDRARYAAEGLDRHADMLSALRKRALDAIGELHRHQPTGLARKKLRTAEYQLRTLRIPDEDVDPELDDLPAEAV